MKEIDMEPPVSSSKLFDIAGSEGINESEQILTRLCSKSFLRLWAQSNTYTDEGFKEGKGGTKELCDALVVFGDDVLIFSDKHIRFQEGKDLNIAWPRWFRRAVVESSRQLQGARAWLSRFPERVFQDPRCTRKLPFPLPTGDSIRFHLIAVTRGTRDAMRTWSGQGMGSLFIDTNLRGDAHLTRPFFIGVPREEGHFVHVFDEVSIELLMSELDTAPDFIGYLKEREDLFADPELAVTAFGEENLLAAYLQTMTEDGSRHTFANLPGEMRQDAHLIFDAAMYENILANEDYLRKKRADEISYFWDELIEKLIALGDPDLRHALEHQDQNDYELALRLLAKEPRFKRRQLTEGLFGAFEKVKPAKRIARVVNSGVVGEPVFIFLIVPKLDDETYDEYRHYRHILLRAYCQMAKLKSPLATVFIGLGFDNPHKNYEGNSEDLFIFQKDTWTEKELQDLERQRQDLGILGDGMQWHRRSGEEIPPEDLLSKGAVFPKRKSNKQDVRKRQKKKMQYASKKKNR